MISIPKFCGAYARTTGNSCLGRSLKNGRCKLHGGLSTGPKTLEGRKRIADATQKRMINGQKYKAQEARWDDRHQNRHLHAHIQEACGGNGGERPHFAV